ncbi:PKD domain-containing protein [Flavobacterium gelidilacus]|uniref:PKD domain-containing protein n=1 Tax=Flavobacterium gelidilacus TaxID=206041 RepID=UPI00047E1391|nr:PKD domain-containing protein [Flavobacterium gelidilacus]
MNFFPYYPLPLNYFCHQDVLNNPFRFFRINYKTFTQSISKIFRISNQFVNPNPPCPNTTATEIAGTIIHNPATHIYYFCPGDADFDLGPLFNPPCFSAASQPSNQYVFRWKLDDTIYPTLGNSSIVDYTNLNLLLNEPNAVNCSAKLTREVQYIDPYCQNKTWYKTEEIIFYVINIGQVPNTLNISGLSDFCLEDHLSFTIEDFQLRSCPQTPIPPLLPGIINNIVIQLTTSVGVPIGAPQTIALPFLNVSTDIVFDIPNIDTSGNFLFPIGSNTVNLEVQMNLYGCSKTIIFKNIDFNIAPQALAGSILLSIDCEEEVNIISVDDGITNVNYTWEFSTNGGGTYLPIPFAPGDANLDSATSYFSTFPVLVRRRSNAFPLCGGPAFTEAIELNDPSTPFLAFNLPATLCNGVVPPILPEISNYGISGNWNESTIETSVPGTYTYVFTPNSVNCLNPFEYVVTILANCEIFLSWDGEVGCQQSYDIGEAPPVEDVDITNNDCIRVCENSVFTFSLTGSVSLITSTDWLITGGTLSNESSTSCDITWDAGVSAYALQAVVHLTDGTIKIVNKCIEKVNAPIAQIGILPDLETTYYSACINSPVNFENLSSNNGGNENLYYQWYFGDETYSTEFEPTHTYTHPGDYDVILTVSNGCSCVSTHQVTVHVSEESIEITCPSVACEGQLSTYSINEELLNSNCSVQWTVIGGQIVGQDYDVSSIQVIWDNIDQDGFGYVLVQSNECAECISSVKIPVVKSEGVIIGEIDICSYSQNLYTLPQWPTTEFNWSLNNNGTGSNLGVSNQRNEIFINAEDPATLVLSCQYYNTLLQCGGNATLIINVKPNLNVNGPLTTCQTNNEEYEILLANGISVINLNYTVNGPNNFNSSGTSPTFDITFPYAGIYTFTVTADNYCMQHPFEVKVESLPDAPTTIAGNAVICLGNIEQYSCPAPEGASTSWTVEGGSILGSSVGNQIVVNFDSAASVYSVSASYVYENCATLPFEMVLSTPQLDTTITSNETTVCGSSMGTYSVAETDSDIYVWTIDPASAGSISTGQNENEITVLWNQQPQTAQVKVAMRKCGQDFNGTLGVVIQDAPTATIALVSSPACAGSPTSFTLDLSPNIAYSYSTWDFGDNTGLVNFFAGDPIIHVYNDPLLDNTNYDINVTVHGVSTCEFNVTANLQIVVSPSPIIDVVPNRNYNLQWEIIPEVDMNYTVVLQNGYSASDIIQWFHNDAAIPAPIGNQATINASELGEYYAIVTNEHGCTSSTITYTTIDSTPGGTGTGGTPGPTCPTPPAIATTVTSTGCQEITIDITNSGVPGTIFNWESISGSNANVMSTTNSSFQANNILPGHYFVPVFATYPAASGFCGRRILVEVTIPYLADLKYNIVCNDATDDYTVELLDYSQYFVDTPIETFQFTINGGTSWVNGSLNADGINSAIFQLQPGTTYSIGIKIGRSGFEDCITYKTLTIPGLPNADFVVPTSVCLDTAMQFIAPTNTDPNVTYTWYFITDGSSNLQQHPVKTFTEVGTYPVKLTVANQFGCVDTRTYNIQVYGEKYNNGLLNINPSNTCIGEDLTISYDTGIFGIDLPYTYYWYHNEVTNPPFAVTSAQNNEIIVTDPGQYFVYVADINGCLTYTTKPVSAVFLPAPAQPVLTGTETICIGGTSIVKVPTNPSLTYLWSLNGILQPQWNGLAEVGMIHNQLGSYTYEVIAQIQSASGDFCTSEVATFEVEVIAQPVVPTIGFDFDSCSPYHVNVFVTNPQAGIAYTWSNGATGDSTEMIHDGPIKVTAKSPSCQVSAQIDLPLDLYMHTWYFPTGCYNLCDLIRKEQNYIIGPLVEFTEWQWIQDSQVTGVGSGQVPHINSLETGNYQLFLQTPFCNTTLSNLSIEKRECNKCQIEFEVAGITPMMINEQCFYQLDLFIGNSYGTNFQVNLASVGLEGYFVQSSFVVPMGGAMFSVLFFPLNGFNGGTTTLSVQGTIDTEQCYSEIEFEVPPLCQGAGKQLANDIENQSFEELKLLVAPNPTDGNTSIYYNFGVTKNNMQIELMDMYGRILKLIKTDKVSGLIEIDCSPFEAGQYLIVMKQEDLIIKNSKLIIK